MNRNELMNRFIANGGTKEEFEAGRRAAMMQAASRKARYEKAARADHKERMFQLMEKGYSEFEAREVLRLEAFEALESAHIIRNHQKIVRSRIPAIGLHEMAPIVTF